MIKVFELLKNFRTKGYKMKTIRNSVFIGASLLGGCASVETYFDALHVACVKDAAIEKEVRLHAQRLWITLIALTRPKLGFSWGF